MRSLITFLLLIAISAADIKRYDGYKVFRVNPQNEEQAHLLAELENSGTDFDFWSDLRRDAPSDIMVTPQAQNNFNRLLVENHIRFEIVIENVEPVLEKERQHQLKSRRVPNGRIGFTEYETYEAIQSYLQQLAIDYPDLVTLEIAATSTEGRDVTGIRISSGSSTRKPIILIDAGIHAREWIAPAVALYAIQQLVEEPSNSRLLANVDWHIIPVVNPDGYDFSHVDTRLWRKTRSQQVNVTCIGVDANRNFDFHWNGPGSSTDPCSQTYAGPSAFSEPEAKGISDWVAKYGDRIKVYIALHSYGNLIMYPWGTTPDLPEDWYLLHNLGVAAGRAIQAVDGTVYTIGTSANILYVVSGGARDYTRAVGGVNASFTIELPRGGSAGFDLPPERIVPVVTETWEALTVFHDYAQLQEV